MKNLATVDPAADTLVCDLFMDAVGNACVTAADEAGLFTCLRDGAKSSSGVASTFGKDPGAIDVVFRVLAAIGFLEVEDGSLYSMSPVTRTYFDKKSPLYRGFQFYSNRESWQHKRIFKMIDAGWDPISQNKESFTEMWEEGTLSQEAADRFTGMMHTNISGPAVALAQSGVFDRFSHVMDAGGGSAVFLTALKQKRPEVGVTLLELPQVCEAAKKIVKHYLPLDAMNFAPCNFFKGRWPDSADAILLSNILHDWPYEKGRVILEKAYDALPVGGSIFVFECLLDEGRLSPKHTVIFDLMMYMNHRAQQYTQDELFGALVEAGFVQPRTVFSFGYYSLVCADKAEV